MHLRLVLSTVAALTLAVGSVAQAADFYMVGDWYSNQSIALDLPINGGPVACAPAVGGCVKQRRANVTATGGFDLFTAEPALGGVHGWDLMTGIGIGTGQTFTVAPKRFNQKYAPQFVQMPNVNFVQQLSTSITYAGPMTSRPKTPPTTTRVLQKNAWSKPGQAGRLAKNFTAVTGPGTATVQASVTYTGNTNGFGGTMGMLLDGGGRTYVVNVFPFPNWVGINPLTDVGPPAARARGMGHDYTATAGQSAGSIRNNFGVNPPCTSMNPHLPVGCELLTFIAPTVVAPLPAAVSTLHGFAWTTGQVVAKKIATAAGNPATTFMTGVGQDVITSGGARAISLVAGGLTRRDNTSGIRYAAQLAVIDMKLIQVPEPGMLLGLLAGIPAVGILQHMRRRRSRC